MNSQDEQHINIKFCIRFGKAATKMIKLLREEYESECITESTIHKWHSTFSKNLNEASLIEKKGGEPQMSITETNINTVWAIIDDDQHLSTSALETLLHIPRIKVLKIL